MADYRDVSTALFPFLSPELVGVFADAWSSFGDPELAMAELRRDPAYDAYFPGIKRADGTLRMSETEYLARQEGYRRTFQSFGLNPRVFEGRIRNLMEGDVSVSELADRMSAAYNQVVEATPQIKEFYASTYGLELDDRAVFASFIDPAVGEDVLNRRISVAQIGGEAAESGFRISADFADLLASRGLTRTQAGELFNTAATELPTFSSLSTRLESGPGVSLESFVGAATGEDTAAAATLRRLAARSAAEFAPGPLATTEDLAVRGLTAR